MLVCADISGKFWQLRTFDWEYPGGNGEDDRKSPHQARDGDLGREREGFGTESVREREEKVRIGSRRQQEQDDPAKARPPG